MFTVFRGPNREEVAWQSLFISPFFGFLRLFFHFCVCCCAMRGSWLQKKYQVPCQIVQAGNLFIAVRGI